MSTSVRSKRVGRMARLVFSAMAVTVFSALVLVGCGEDDDGNSPILPQDEVWKRESGIKRGLTFNKDGTLTQYYVATLSGWTNSTVGSWSGNTITYSNGNRGTFERIGDQLTIYSEDGKAEVYRKILKSEMYSS